MRWVLRIFLLVLLLLIAVPAGLLIALNTGGGRQFAAAQINKFLAGQVHVTGLGGHFPADIKIAALSVSDADGVWLRGDKLELRWLPQALFSRNLHITSLTADAISVARSPVASKKAAQKSNRGIPNIRVAVDHLAIGRLNLGPALAGSPVTLGVTGATHLKDAAQGDVALNAEALNGQGSYQLNAVIDHQNISAVLHVAEPPDGLLGHYAGPQVNAPLHIDLTLAGPRDAAALNFTASLGAARLDGAGMLGLDPAVPRADVIFTLPSIAPVAAIAGQNVAGSTKLHLVASQVANATNIALDGDVALAQAPGKLAQLMGRHGHLALLVKIADNTVNIQNLVVTGAGFSMAATGNVAAAKLDLDTHLVLNNVASVAPGITGGVTEDGTIIGAPRDFAIAATLSGDVADPDVPSGPFKILIDARHLPDLPVGTLTGSGALEGFPLMLDAAFARDAAGNARLKINAATWRSLSAEADLALAGGADVPTGTAKFSIKRLADFAKFSPVPLAGSVDGNFAHGSAQDFTLNVNAQNLAVSPALGAVNAKLNADGPIDALGVKFSATVAKIIGAPAQIAAAGVIDVKARSVALSGLTASWKTVNAKLLGPASIETRPDVVIQHLAMGLNGGTLRIDGTVSPGLNLRAAVQNLPANLADLAGPGINATGTLDATAALTGSIAVPYGKITLAAHAIKSHSGPAAAIPEADLVARATLAGKSANIDAKLGVGPNIQLTADGLVPLSKSGPISLHVTGTTDLRLLDPILAAQGNTVRGIITPDIMITGTAAAPRAGGTITLADGSVQNIATGLNLTKIAADVSAADKLMDLRDFSATAGKGTITGHGTVNLGAADLPVDLAIDANNAAPISSDIVTENFDAALTVKGALRGALALGGNINILSANINIPKSLPPSVANLPIINRGEKPPPPPPPPPDIALDVTVRAHDQVFVRGDGLFAELGGRVHITGTAANPDPEGGFTLIRGYFALDGKTLQFTKGVVSFIGEGFIPSLDLEATSTTSTNATVTLIIGGTAAKPTITLTSSPALPSDEILSQLLFGQSVQSLSPLQAASLAAALASLAGIGGGGGSDPLGSVRNALGLDELSIGSSPNSSAPTVQAGRYVAPGVYVGAVQSTTGQGTQATVEINLYKGLKLQTATGTAGSSSGQSSSVGLTYQFNY